jgi:hypothetical protein
MPYNIRDIQIDTSGLDAMIHKNPQKFADVVGKTCFRILSKARMVTPRDPARPPKDESQPVSGALRANSDVVKVDPIGLTQRVEYYQEYAAAQELGYPAGNLPARPFLTPSTEQEAAQFVEDLGKVMRNEA